MLEGALEKLLLQYLAPYVDGIVRENLRLGVFSGSIELRDLKVKPEALSLLGLDGFRVGKGMVTLISLRVPLKDLYRGKVHVIIDSVQMHVVSIIEEGQKQPDETTLATMRQDKEESVALRVKQYQEAAKSQAEVDAKPGFAMKLTRKIINNIKVDIMGVKLELSSTKGMAGAIEFKGLHVLSTDKDFQELDEVVLERSMYKMARLENLCMRMSLAGSSKLEGTEYLLTPVSGVVKLAHELDDPANQMLKLRIEVATENLAGISLLRSQVKHMRSIMDSHSAEKNRLHLLRISPEDERGILENLQESKDEYSRFYERHLLHDWNLAGDEELPLTDLDRKRMALLEDALSIWLLANLRYVVYSKVEALNQEVARRKAESEAKRIEEERAKASFWRRNFGRFGSGTSETDHSDVQWISSEEREQLMQDFDDESKVETVDVPKRMKLEIAIGRFDLDLIDDRTEIKERRQLLNLLMTALELGVTVESARDYAGVESAEWKVDLHLNGFNAKHACMPMFNFDAPSRRDWLGLSDEPLDEASRTLSFTSTSSKKSSASVTPKHAAELVVEYLLQQDCNLLKILLNFQPLMINCIPGAVDQLLEFLQPPEAPAADLTAQAIAIDRFEEHYERTVQMVEANKEKMKEVGAKLFQLIPDKIDLNLSILSPILNVPIEGLGTAKFSLGGLKLRTTTPAELLTWNLSLDLDDTVLSAESDRGEYFDMIKRVPVHVDIEFKGTDEAQIVKVGVEVKKITAMLAPQALSILLATPMQLASVVMPSNDAAVPQPQKAPPPTAAAETGLSRFKRAAKQVAKQIVGSDGEHEKTLQEWQQKIEAEKQKQVTCDVSVQVHSANLTLADSIVPVMQLKADMAEPGVVVFFQKTPNMLNIVMTRLMLEWDIFNPRNGSWEPFVERFAFDLQMDSKLMEGDARNTSLVVSGQKPLLLNLTPSAVKRAALILPQFAQSLTFAKPEEASGGGINRMLTAKLEYSKYRCINLSDSPIVLKFNIEDDDAAERSAMEVKPTGSEWQSLDAQVLRHFVKALTCELPEQRHSEPLLLERAGATVVPSSGLVAELVTPDPSHRLLLLGSPVRLHNQTDLCLVVRFHNAASREVLPLETNTETVCDAALLGYVPPVGYVPPDKVHSSTPVDENSVVLPPNSVCAVPARALVSTADGSKRAMISTKPMQCGARFCAELEVGPRMEAISVFCRGDVQKQVADMHLVCESRCYDGNGIASDEEERRDKSVSPSTITVISFRPPLSLLNALPIGDVHVGFAGLRDESAPAPEMPNDELVPCFRRLNVYSFQGMLRQGLCVRVRLTGSDRWSSVAKFSSEAFEKESEGSNAKDSESMKILPLRQRPDGADAGVAVEPISCYEIRFSCPHWYIDRSGLDGRLHQLELRHRGAALPCGIGPGCKGPITLLPADCQEEPCELVLRSQGPLCKSNILFPPNWNILTMKTTSRSFVFCTQTEDVARADVLGAQCQVMALKPMLVFTNSSDCRLEVRTASGILRLEPGSSIEHHWEVRRGEEDSPSTTVQFRPDREGVSWSDDVVCSAKQAGSTPFMFAGADTHKIWSVVVAPARGELAVTFQRGSNFAARHDAKRTQVRMLIRPAGCQSWGDDDIPVECGELVQYGWIQPFRESKSPRAVEIILTGVERKYEEKFYIDDVRRHQWNVCPEAAALGLVIRTTHEGAMTVLQLLDRESTTSTSSASAAAPAAASSARPSPSSSVTKVEVKLGTLGVSLVRDTPRPGELLYMHFDLLRLEFLQTGSGLQELGMIVSDMQIDCQLGGRSCGSGAPARSSSSRNASSRKDRDDRPAVIVANGADGDLSFLKLGVRRLVTANRTMLLPSVEIALDTLDISVDDEWARPLFEFIQSANPGKDSLSGVRFETIAKSASVPVTEGFVAPPLPLVLQVESFKISAINLTVWAILHLKSIKFLPLYLKNIIRVLSFSDVLRLEGAELKLREKSLPPQRGSALDFVQALKSEYQENVLKNLASILGKSSLLNLPRTPVKLGGATFAFVTESIGLGFGEAGSVLQTLTMDEEYQRRQQAIRANKNISDIGSGMVEAGKSLAQGFEGALDVFRKPVQGAKADGIGGFFGGLGKGLVGTVVKPVSAIGQAFQDVGSGVAASVSPDTVQMKRRRERERIRKPRLLFTELGVIRAYSALEAAALQQLGRGFLRGVAELVPYEDEDCAVLILFPERLCMADLKLEASTDSFSRRDSKRRQQRGATSSSFEAKQYQKKDFLEAADHSLNKMATQAFKPVSALTGGRLSLAPQQDPSQPASRKDMKERAVQIDFVNLLGVSWKDPVLELVLKDGTVLPFDLGQSTLGAEARKALAEGLEHAAKQGNKLASWEKLRAMREEEERQAANAMKSESSEGVDVSVVGTGAGQRILEVWELERYRHLTNNWETAFLLTDRESSYRWVDATGHRHPHLKQVDARGQKLTREWYAKQQRPPCELTELFKAVSDWKLDVNASTDDVGWRYALNWNSSSWDTKPAMFDSVRKRRWTKAYA